jgi:hypothetical protein
MTQNTQFLRSGNLFSMIVQTNLATNAPEQITLPTEIPVNTIPTTPTIDEPTITGATELTFSELTASNLESQKIRVAKKAKIIKNNTNFVRLTGNNSFAFTPNQYNEKGFTYTIENANACYASITGESIVQPFNILSSKNQETFYKSVAGPDITNIVTYTFDDTNKKLQMLVIDKRNISLWSDGPKQTENWNKISPIFQNQNNKKNFRRIVKLMAAFLAREAGYFGGRYGNNNALMQLEYSAICWAIINMTKKQGFNSEGEIIKLLDSNYGLNIFAKKEKMKQDDKRKLVKGRPGPNDTDDPFFNQNETDEAIDVRETANIKSIGKYLNNNQNLELYVMAFFNGLINEEFPGGTNWSHIRTDDDTNPGESFRITPFRIHPKIHYLGVEYPRFVNDGIGPSTYGANVKTERFSNGNVYTIAGGKPNILISIN